MVDPLMGNDQFTYVRHGGNVSAKIHRQPSNLTAPVIEYTHTDHLGSPVAGTDSAGNVAWRERYTPYGEKLLNPTALDNQAAFTGHIYDSATGLTYMQARYYDPNIGRFLSIDPVNVTPSTPGMFNRYAYVTNDPINKIDPDGEFAMLITGAVGAVVGGAVGGGIEAYKQHKANPGRKLDWGKIGSRAGKGAFVGGAVGLTGGAAAGVVGLTGATGAGAAATIALPSAAVAATGNAIVGITNDIADGAAAETIGRNGSINMATGALGAGIGGGASPIIGKALTKASAFGGAGNLNGAGVIAGEALGAAVGSGVTEGGNAIPPPKADIEENR